MRELLIVFSLSTCYHISERLRRATKRGKFSRAACREFDFELNLRQQEIPKQKNYPNLSHRFNINFAPTLGNLKCFNGHENRSFCSTMTNYIAEIF